MRQIKFRAWDKKLKAWHKWTDIRYGELSEFLGIDGEQISDCVLVQFTGLQDKNGKPIYEGDLLEQQTFVGWCPIQGGFELFLSKFNDDGSDYCLACGGDIHWFEVAEDPKHWEVIGDIYSTPPYPPSED